MKLAIFGCVSAVVFLSAAWALAKAPAVTGLKCEYKTNPIGIDQTAPRLSWRLLSDQRGVVQSAYQIRVAASDQDVRSAQHLLWDSGKIGSSQSVHVPYGGSALASGQRACWQVRGWDGADQASSWSQPAFWEMGLLGPADWQAQWIQPDIAEDTKRMSPAQMLRAEFELAKPVKSARAYITALGLYEAKINGSRVGADVFTPGWTSYDTRLQYQTYDVTGLLQAGRNAIGVTLGDGWYRGNLAWRDNRNTWGDKLALLLQINVTLADGTKQTIVSDGSWQAATGPILSSDIYNGESYDARRERPGWSRAGYRGADLAGVVLIKHRKDILIAPQGPPVRKIAELKPVKILTTPAGDTVVDMGQNMVGWVRLKVQGPAGTKVTLRHAEVLDKQGNFYTENLRRAKQTVTYTLKGAGQEVYEPHFTFQGFRYVAVDGYPGKLSPASLTGIVVHSDMAVTGGFETSNPLLNQLQHNIQWGQKGNFVDVPTDCPQRDERLGWTGDAQVFCPTACFNMDAAGFFTKWLRDMAADQQPDGAIPHVIPNVLSHGKPTGASAAAGWADAAVVVPWKVYLAYGDKRVLANQYDCMKKWVGYMEKRAGAKYLWLGDRHFGDWLAFSTNHSDYPGATTSTDLIATAYFAYSTGLLQKTARVLGNAADAQRYGAQLAKIKAAFNREFVTPNGRLSSDTQTAYSLALAFDLLPKAQRPVAARRLAGDVQHFQHITTGFIGAPLICPVLMRYGYDQLAYLLLNRKTYPSWLYPITRGATTIWERWDGIKPDGTFQDKGMNSFNHYAYGAIGQWLYRAVAGLQIDQQEPGYRHTIIQPHPGGGLTRAAAWHDSLYGKVASGWEIKDGRITVRVTVPPNTHASVHLPQAKLAAVSESGAALAAAAGVSAARQDGDAVVAELGSGAYLFAYPWPAK